VPIRVKKSQPAKNSHFPVDTPRAAQTTIAIVEAYAKIRELARTVSRLSEAAKKPEQQTLMQRSGEIMADILGEGMKTTDSETTYELNFALMKFKHTVRKKAG